MTLGRQALLVCVAAVSAGCYPGQVTDAGEPDLVLSFVDPAVAFEFTTYAMPDSIVRLDAAGGTAPGTALDRQILDAVAAELSAFGWTRVEPGASAAPDVLVLLTVAEEDQPLWVGERWPDAWSWFSGWDWYGISGGATRPVWSWSERYPGVWARGTLSVSMLDASAAGPDGVPVVWSGLLNRLFADGESRARSDFQSGLRTLFEASPWLAVGGGS